MCDLTTCQLALHYNLSIYVLALQIYETVQFQSLDLMCTQTQQKWKKRTNTVATLRNMPVLANSNRSQTLKRKASEVILPKKVKTGPTNDDTVSIVSTLPALSDTGDEDADAELGTLLPILQNCLLIIFIRAFEK